ncbi:tetratricopeptide repeat protein [Cohnella lubricantis]|uniref:Tetratricopeptide repeat protein n=1 Tax=Cohnella lubricantis TaxID=2163172 RepID=A0A841TDT4_9BACL|nr:tetratricopeptide repeat protein [Cohnella lubricantis]MBB6679603.1 tetratricopeptide repeat protein [Cohnella lubricantis]MBP2119929.1 tetratricopeptide (TPR) repeat protein [Cohnella lubricantis]
MDGESCIQQAYEAIFRGDYEAAGAWFERAVEAEPSNASYYYRGSITLARSGKLHLALEYARRAVELAPEEPAYWEQLRMLQARRKIGEARELLSRHPAQSAMAVPLLQEAFHMDPLAADARLLLGIAYRMLGEYDKAIESLQDALQLNPQYEEARKLLSVVRSERRRKRRKT